MEDLDSQNWQCKNFLCPELCVGVKNELSSACVCSEGSKYSEKSNECVQGDKSDNIPPYHYGTCQRDIVLYTSACATNTTYVIKKPKFRDNVDSEEELASRVKAMHDEDRYPEGKVTESFKKSMKFK